MSTEGAEAGRRLQVSTVLLLPRSVVRGGGIAAAAARMLSRSGRLLVVLRGCLARRRGVARVPSGTAAAPSAAPRTPACQERACMGLSCSNEKSTSNHLVTSNGQMVLPLSERGDVQIIRTQSRQDTREGSCRSHERCT